MTKNIIKYMCCTIFKKVNWEDLIMMIQNIDKYMCSTKRLMPPLTGI